jgi:hypothetical protein
MTMNGREPVDMFGDNGVGCSSLFWLRGNCRLSADVRRQPGFQPRAIVRRAFVGKNRRGVDADRYARVGGRDLRDLYDRSRREVAAFSAAVDEMQSAPGKDGTPELRRGRLGAVGG